MSIVALPAATPVRVPRSVPPSGVVHVSAPRADGTVTLAFLDLTVPFVVVPILSTERVPLASTVGFPSLHGVAAVPHDRMLIGPSTAAPVFVEVVPSTVEVVHVLAKKPNVSARSAEVPDLS